MSSMRSLKDYTKTKHFCSKQLHYKNALSVTKSFYEIPLI